MPEIGNADLPRDSQLTLIAPLPSENDMGVWFSWDASFGTVILRQVGDNDNPDAYTGFLKSGAESPRLSRTGPPPQSTGAIFVDYLILGFEHILPKGLDHILFVLSLFFLSLKFRPLLIQVTAFTLAHTITLALAVLDLVTLPADIVEPLIALSIAYVAIENLMGTDIKTRRTVIVFLFGLLHGLGFASVLTDVGLSSDRLVISLIGFTLGVEVGQLAVILGAYLLLGLPFGGRTWYRRAVIIPGSAAIAVIGVYWTVERILGGLS